jgi:DNA invertase Pin-like site-specific DNA recombinase
MYITPQLRGDEKAEYVRKSRADDPLLSVEEVLEKHERMIAEWVEKNQPEGGPIPEENCFREVASGESLEARPEMQRLLKLIESPKIKAIICVEPSRLSRGSLKEIGTIVDLIRYTNTLVITMQYTYDLNDDRDRELFERELMRGNDYLEYTKKILANGRLASVSAGNYIVSVAPYGYKKVMRKEGNKKCHTLEAIPEQAEVVRRIFEMYRDGMGADRIADRLNMEHIPAPKKAKWVRESLYDILDNVHYLGKVKWNQNKAIKTVIDGKVVTRNLKAKDEDYLIFEGKHSAIIDQELWDAVKAIRGSHPRNNKAGNFSNPLAGLLWCKNCGRAMVFRRFLDKKGNERCTSRLHCKARRLCGTASATVPEVLDEVIKVLEDAIEDFEVRIERGADDSAEVHRRLVERLERKLEELKDLEKKQWTEKLKGEMPSHIFKELNAETVAEIEEVHHALCEAKDAVPEPIDLQSKVVTFKAAIDALRDPDAPVLEKNLLLKACIERIEYHREKKEGNPRWGKPQPIELHFHLKV